MPTVQLFIISPIFEQFAELLPDRTQPPHPLGCHNPGILDRVIFDKLVQVLFFSRAYEGMDNDSCSAKTLCGRREEWIFSGAMERLRDIVFDAYDWMIGLELSEVVVDGCITKAPCAGEKMGRSSADRGNQGINARRFPVVVHANGIPFGAIADMANRYDPVPLEQTLDTL